MHSQTYFPHQNFDVFRVSCAGIKCFGGFLRLIEQEMDEIRQLPLFAMVFSFVKCLMFPAPDAGMKRVGGCLRSIEQEGWTRFCERGSFVFSAKE